MRKIFLLMVAVVMAVTLASCGGAAPEPVEVSDEMTDDDVAAVLTQQYFQVIEIDEYTFGDKEAPLGEVSNVVKPAVDSCLADPTFQDLNSRGYKVYAVGHGCTYGGSGANLAVGNSRAMQVVYELRALGVDTTKLGYKSVGDQMPKDEVGLGRPEQRRVTFEVARR
jgi:outer membrane protein OmpA-like peptidoglycan-associated protein